jgi:hypothetical protein
MGGAVRSEGALETIQNHGQQYYMPPFRGPGGWLSQKEHAHQRTIALPGAALVQ